MPDAAEFVKIIKKAAVEAVEAEKPAGIYFGTVTSVNPLRIRVEQKMTLEKEQLVLTRNVTDYETEDSSVQNALKQGEEVILFRMQGGQRYVVTDRIGGI